MSGYFCLEFDPKMPASLRHTLNRRYKGASRFEMIAPDAAGTLLVWARNEDEARDHLLNALFDLIFNRNRCGASLENPACIYCGHRTESRGRNSSGTRAWRCLNLDCQRSFVIGRTYRGGINHHSQSKKPDFHRLVFVEGKTIAEVCDVLGISHGAADKWYAKMAAVNGGADKRCPCGKQLRHRGSCSFRQQYRKLRRHEITRSDLGERAKRAVS